MHKASALPAVLLLLPQIALGFVSRVGTGGISSTSQEVHYERDPWLGRMEKGASLEASARLG